MTNIYKIPCLFLILALFSCSDDEVELPRSEPDFSIEPAIVEVGVPVTFDNLTINASRYEWDFGDNQTSEETSPSHTYEEAGTFIVTLKAYTNDNQMDSVSKEIEVGQRFLTGIEIQSVALFNAENEPWDPVEGADSTKYPDIIVFLGPEGDQNVGGSWYFGPDAAPGSLPRGIPTNPQSDPFILTNETWLISFIDFDGEDIENIKEEDLERMNGPSPFNPVLLPTSVVTEEGQGLLQLAGNGYHVNIFFEIK